MREKSRIETPGGNGTATFLHWRITMLSHATPIASPSPRIGCRPSPGDQFPVREVQFRPFTPQLDQPQSTSTAPQGDAPMSLQPGNLQSRPASWQSGPGAADLTSLATALTPAHAPPRHRAWSSRPPMPGQPWRHLVRPLLLLILLVFVPQGVEARVLHLIICGDTLDPGLGQHAEWDCKNLRATFYVGVAEKSLVIHEHNPRMPLRSAGILNLIQRVNPQPDDAVMFFFAGHGAYDQQGHYLALAGGRDALPRQRIIQALQAKRVGLTVVVTDACYSFFPRVRLPPMAGAGAPFETLPLFQRLFFETRGFIDLNACSQGEVALQFKRPTDGGLYTNAWTKSLSEHSQDADPGFGWPQFLKTVELRTGENFQQLFPNGFRNRATNQVQYTQTPAVLKLAVQRIPGVNNDPQPFNRNDGDSSQEITNATLAAQFLPQGGRLKIQSVNPESPLLVLSRQGDNRVWRLEEGDELVAVNGARVDCQNCLEKALLQGGGNVTLDVVGGADRAPYRFLMQAKANPPGRQPENQPRGRFGAYTSDSNGQGAEVIGVVPNSAATRLLGADGRAWYLERGDRIVTVNGTRIRGQSDFVQAVNLSGRQMSLEVISNSNGQRYEFTVTLGQ
jgi:hypothetical protein